MFEMPISRLVADIKEMLLPRGQPNDKALYMRFDVSMHVYKPTDIRRRCFLNFILYCPHGGSVHTFFAEEPFHPYIQDLRNLKWDNTSNHDSCWRSDGVDSPVSRVYSRMADEINAQLDAQGFKTIAPAHMHKHVNLSWGPAWKLIDVEVRRDPDQDYHYLLML